MLKNNYHTHMRYCNHAVGEVEDYVKTAYELGYLSLGMSDHAPIPLNSMTKEEWDHNYCGQNMTMDTFNIYLKDIENAQKKYPNIKVYKALESEYLRGYDSWYKNLRDKLDYMILGIHFFKDNTGKVLDTYEDLNYNNLDYYYQNMEEAVKTGLYDYLAHPDLFYFDYKDKNGNHTFDDKCIDITHKICKLALKYDLPLEINCNGLHFSSDKENIKNFRYPVYDFWNIAKDYKGLKIILGVDAHNPNLLGGEWILKAKEFCKELNIKYLEKLDF